MRYSSRLNQLAAVFICVSLFIALPTTGHTADKSDAIRQFQKSLIDDEITGSNVVMIHRDGKRIYHKAVQSGKEGDRDIDQNPVPHLVDDETDHHRRDDDPARTGQV